MFGRRLAVGRAYAFYALMLVPVLVIPWLQVAAADQKALLMGIIASLSLFCAATYLWRNPRIPGSLAILFSVVPLMIVAILSAAVAATGYAHALWGDVSAAGTAVSYGIFGWSIALGSLQSAKTAENGLVLYMSAAACIGGLALLHAFTSWSFVVPFLYSTTVLSVCIASAFAVSVVLFDMRASGNAWPLLCAVALAVPLVYFYSFEAVLALELTLASFLLYRVAVFRGARVTPVASLIAIVAFLAIAIFHMHPILAASDAEIRPSVLATSLVVGAEFEKKMGYALIGTGPASFPYTWEQYRDYAHNTGTLWALTPSAGYSLLMTILAELGVSGILAFFVPFGVLAYLMARLRLAPVPSQSHEHVHTAYASIGLVIFFSSWVYPIPLFLLAIGGASIGCVGALGTWTDLPLRHSIRLLCISVLLVLGAVLLGVYLRQFAAAEYYADATLESNAERSAAEFSSAARMWPSSRYEIAASHAKYQQASVLQSTDADVARSLLREVLTFADRSIGHDSRDYAPWLYRGALYSALGGVGSSEGISYIARAVIDAPRRPDLRYIQAQLYMRNGNLRDALSAIEQALVLKPDYQEASDFLRLLRENGTGTDAGETAL